jgi:tetratricopeptide (TPR) repeat protein
MNGLCTHHSRGTWPYRSCLFLLGIVFAVLASAAGQKPTQKEGWLELHSSHFAVFTDAGEKRGREVAVRLEQMRAIFGGLLMRDKLRMTVPLDVIALKGDKDYQRVSPVRGGTPISEPGFFLAREDRNTAVLNLFAEEPWRAIAHPLAHVLLNGNYPPTQPWFDEGIAEYFSSVRVDNKQADMGGDPEVGSKYDVNAPGRMTQVRNPARSLTELLQAPVWLNMADLFRMKLNTPEFQEGTHHTMFYAQSWITMHYLLKKAMLPQVGNYFDQVQNQNAPVEKAMQQAFGMAPEQFEKAVKDYFQSLRPLFSAQDRADAGNTRVADAQVYQASAPFGPDDVAIVVRKVDDDSARALVADVLARQPEHREEGIKELQAIAQGPTDNEIAHRSLAFAFIQSKNYKEATDELDQAEGYDAKDPWVRYYRALIRFKMAQDSGKSMEGGLANVIQNLKGVVDWNPEFAEAYHLLGLAQLEGGGAHAALESMRTAVQLSPRNQWYVFNIAEIYLAQKKWDDAQGVLERLRTSLNPQVATAAKKKLDDLPFMRKYGIPPERAAEIKKQETAEVEQAKREEQEQAKREAAARAEEELKLRGPDRRPVQFVKGKIVKVDCTKAPVAVITLTSATRTLRLKTADYKSLVVVGADAFSCDWQNQAASVNYKTGSNGVGDLVSVEVH